MIEQTELQLLHRRGRVETEVGGKPAPPAFVSGQRLLAAPGPVEGDEEQPLRLLAIWRVVDERFESGDGRVVIAGRELGGQVQLAHGRAQVLQPSDLRERERRIFEPGERVAPPRRHGVAEQARRLRWFVSFLGRTGLAQQARLCRSVDVDMCAEPIAGGDGLDGLRPEHATDARHVHLHGVAGRCGWLRTPQRVDDRVT